MKIKNIDEIENDSKMLKIKLDTKFLKEDLERYYIDEKKSLAEISRIYGCSFQTVRRRLEGYGISIRSNGLSLVKKDLEKYYVEEEKSISEISKIYKCGWSIVKRELEKYGISIRPHGAFLVDDDGESLNSKRNNDEISDVDYGNKLARKRGYDGRGEYLNSLVKDRGFENWNDYNSKMRYMRGNSLSMSKNKDCASYLGVHICENKEFLSKIINIIKNMPYGNPGYDVICIRDKKIDVKCSCLSRDSEWVFTIDKNKTADYFLMISFDNRENLIIQHIWLVKGDAVIEKTSNFNSREFIVNEKDSITISKGNRGLKRWKIHEITNTYKLKEAQNLCNKIGSNIIRK